MDLNDTIDRLWNLITGGIALTVDGYTTIEYQTTLGRPIYRTCVNAGIRKAGSKERAIWMISGDDWSVEFFHLNDLTVVTDIRNREGFEYDI